MSCHYATYGKDNVWEQHKEVEREVFRQLNTMLEEALGGGKMSGASMERIIEAEMTKLKISRREKGLDIATEYVPASIKMASSIAQAEREGIIWKEAYLQGVKDATSNENPN
jgi:hypothetical protein